MGEYKLEKLTSILERKQFERLNSFSGQVRSITSLFSNYNVKSTLIPNENILLSNFVINESLESSKIENIFTTKDKLYKHIIIPKESDNATKEAYRYALAIKWGFDLLKKNNMIDIKKMESVHKILMNNTDGIRNTEGTVIINAATKEVIYTPPESWNIYEYLHELEGFITGKISSGINPFVKMAIIHHHFESIHPFYDGNGRLGRIINVLYLYQEGYLLSPTLYMSKHINKTRSTYYELLQDVRDNDNWEEWIEYILDILYLTLKEGIETLDNINTLYNEISERIQNKIPKIYSKELVDNIFTYPYTKVSILSKAIKSSDNTARAYLKRMANSGILVEKKHNSGIYYINESLIKTLKN